MSDLYQTKTVKIIRSCRVNGNVLEAGKVISGLNTDDANILVAQKQAVIHTEKPKPVPKSTPKVEG